MVRPLIRRCRSGSPYPGRKRLYNRLAKRHPVLLHTGIAWHDLPLGFGYSSGVTCWRRLREWQQAGVWERLHHELLERLHQAGEIDSSRAIAGSSQIRALFGGSRRRHPQSIVGARAQSAIS